MKTHRIAAFFLGIACLCLSISPAHAKKPTRKQFGKGNPFTLEELPAGKLKSKLKTLNPKSRQKAMEQLHKLSFAEFDAADHLRVDEEGGIFIICPDGHGNCDGVSHKHTESNGITTESTKVQSAEITPTDEQPATSAAPVPISSPPVYNSKPGAPYHIYLDFNGAFVTGKAWSQSYTDPDTGVTTTWREWDCKAWSTDSDLTTFSDSEQASIRRMWERVAEDYAPFDVNVTTDVTYDPENYTGNKNKVGWLLITPTIDNNGARCPHYDAGGVAYVDKFGRYDYFSKYQPAWVTPMGDANTAEAASHEMGHNMGLSHDGLSTGAVYYRGHVATSTAPSWGPIMGTGYDRDVSQWSKTSEYYNGNQPQDDLAIIAGKITYRADDHGSTFETATPWSTARVSQTGIVERTNSQDFFTFITGAGSISFNANTYRCDTETSGGNLDIILEVYDETQALVASSNPAAGTDASISATVPAGKYYLVVKPTGAGSPLSSSPSGYTVYGSLGQYTVTGNYSPEDGIILSSPGGGEIWLADIAYDITWASAMGGNVKLELFKGGSLQSTIATSTPNDGYYSWTIPASQTLGSDYKIRITSVEQPDKSDESASNFTITSDPLAGALDTAALVWTSSSYLPWFSQTTTTYDGVDAAQSGAIDATGTSFLETTIVGPGTLMFRWKVSSESGHDFLRFYLNGVEQTGSLSRISGEVDWVQRTVNLPALSNVVRWSYTKDFRVDGGLDAAWVDQVVFTPVSAPEIAVEQPVGTDLADGNAFLNFGSVNTGGSSSAFTFTIKNTGDADLTGLAITKDGTHSADYTLGALGTTTLAPGTSTTFTVTFSPGALGSRTAAIHIASNDADENPFDINLTGSGIGSGSLVVSSSDGLSSSGDIGGPFSPESIVYTLSNPGGTSINWGATKTANWVDLSAAGGTLAAGASTNVTVSINSNANALGGGSYDDAVSFTSNTTGSTTRSVALAVNTPPVVNAGPDQSIYLTGNSWSPAALTPAAWLDASTATINAGTVSIANAGSGGGTVSGPASLTANGIGNLQTVQFSGSGQYVSGDYTNTGNTLTAFIVGKSSSSSQASYAGMMSVWDTAQANDYNNAESACLFIQNAGTANSIHSYRTKALSSATGTLTNAFLAATVFNGTNNTLFLNGTTANTVNIDGNFNTGKVVLGARRTNSTFSTFWNGSFGEAILCNASLSATDRQKMEGYLAHRWGLTANLPADHPYKTESPNNAQAIATLAGTASDADDHSLTYQWTFVSGPASVTFDNATSIDATATFTTAGIYILRLTANDGFTQISDDIVITVNPEQSSFSVTYSDNGSSGGTAPVDANNPYLEGTTVTVLGNTGSLVRTGYTFDGWNTAADGSGTTYAAGDTFTISSTTTLYAQWFIIPYDDWAGVQGLVGMEAERGANPDGDKLSNLQEYAFGTDPTVPAFTPVTFVTGGAITSPGVPTLMNFAPAGQPDDNRAVFTRRKDHAAAGLVYTVEFSGELGLWTASDVIPTVLTDPNSADDIEVVSVPFPASVPPATGVDPLPPKFFRIGVTEQ